MNVWYEENFEDLDNANVAADHVQSGGSTLGLSDIGVRPDDNMDLDLGDETDNMEEPVGNPQGPAQAEPNQPPSGEIL